MIVAIGVIIAIALIYSWNSKIGLILAALAAIVLFSKWKG